MGGYVKKGKNKNRGYCGYIIDSFGNKKLIRSSNEYVLYRWLKEKKVLFSVESQRYEINGRIYKPDFFIFKDGKIKTIIEVKHYEEDVLQYIEDFSSFFKSMNINYWVIGYSNLYKIIKRMNLKKDIESYKETSIKYNSKIGYKGEENGMYGCKHTAESKRKNGKKTKERMNDPEWKEKWLKSVNEKIQSQEYKENFKRGIEKRTKRILEENYEERKCPGCGRIFLTNKRDNEWKTCSKKCMGIVRKKRYALGHYGKFQGPNLTDESKRKQMRTIVINLLVKMGLHSIQSFENLQKTLEAKRKEKLYPNNKPSKVEFFEKYFESVDDLNRELERKLNENKKH